MYRKYFHIPDNVIYLNSASTGIPCLEAVNKGKQHIDYTSEKGSIPFDDYISILNETRTMCGDMIHTNSENIALLHNTTHAVKIIKNAFQDYRDIVIFGKSFPCTEIPFVYDRKYKIKVISDDEYILERELKQSSKTIVFTDATDIQTGALRNLRVISEICKSHNALFAIDSIQMIGWKDIYISDIEPDFLFTGTSKWLLGPQGVGFMYAYKKHLSRITNNNAAWLSLNFAGFEKFSSLPKLKCNMSAAEGGTKNLLGIIMMRENLRFLLNIGMDNIEKHNLKLNIKLSNMLAKYGDISLDVNSINSPILFFKAKKVKQIFNHLKKDNVIASFRDGRIRFSCHIFNNEEQMNKISDLIKRYVN